MPTPPTTLPAKAPVAAQEHRDAASLERIHPRRTVVTPDEELLPYDDLVARPAQMRPLSHLPERPLAIVDLGLRDHVTYSSRPRTKCGVQPAAAVAICDSKHARARSFNATQPGSYSAGLPPTDFPAGV